ncbi:MAG: hypothetical protein JWP44_3740 [Mucilaginibacter sp.]|nr:hypothetical protein [Mucilaginibacter sp.]
MKAISLFFVLAISILSSPQQGKVYGAKPGSVGLMDASKIETAMGNKTRVSATIKGKVIKVIKEKGGWFDMDAGKGKVISAHFKDYNVNLPMDLKGRSVVIEGTVSKQFTADDSQHLAGSGKQHGANANPKQKLSFEVTGLMVEN